MWWILCRCDWYTLHGAWWWTALWPCPRPFPSGRPRKTNVYQHLTYMVVQVPGISAGNDQCTSGLICPTLVWHQMLYPLIQHFLVTVIGSAVHWLFAINNIAFGASFTSLWLPLWLKNQFQYILLNCFTHGSSNVPLLIAIGCVYTSSRSWTGQSEVWMQSVVPQYNQPCTCWFATTL